MTRGRATTIQSIVRAAILCALFTSQMDLHPCICSAFLLSFVEKATASCSSTHVDTVTAEQMPLSENNL